MTSLAEQLKRLAIPQTLQQREIKKKPSLLFDEKEAGNLDRDAIFEIGLDGLKDLIEKDPVFSQFSENLFDISSRSFERTVQSKDVNVKLDKTIRKFLQLLSPYLLLKPAHKALEWLICRYHIQDLNINDLMALILPYHEAKIFAKVLQLINLNLPASKQFTWLESIKKQGVHLPKLILVNHIISDSSFLRFICDSFTKTLEEHKNSVSIEKLGTVINFYCVTLVNILTRKEITDHHMTIILPSLIYALRSESLNVKAAAYIICGELVVKHKVAHSLLDEIVDHIMKSDENNLYKEQALLLLLILQNQEYKFKFSSSSHEKLLEFKKILTKLSDTVHIEPFLKVVKGLGEGKGEEEESSKSSTSKSPSASNVALDKYWSEALKECHGDKKESTWLKLRPHLIQKVNTEELFEALCTVAPSYDKLVLMLCLDKILKKQSKQKQSRITNNILKSNFGSTNPYILEISQSFDSGSSVQEVLESYVAKQHKEYDNPVEFEPWLVAMKELDSLNQFSDDNPIWELGLNILIAALPVEFNATPALQILQFLRASKIRKVKIRIDVLNAIINYMSRHGIQTCEWFDLSSKNSEIWLKVRLLELIFDGIYGDQKAEREFNEILDTFSKEISTIPENLISFISAVCGGTPFESSTPEEHSISPSLQIYALHSAWNKFKSYDQTTYNYFYPGRNRALCHLLFCLSNPCEPIRTAAFKVVQSLITLFEKYQNLEETLFLKQLYQRSVEIQMDHEQLSIVLYYLVSPSKSVQATLDSKLVPSLNKTRNELFKIISSENTPIYVSAKLLSILEVVNSQEIVLELTPLGLRALQLAKESVIPRSIVSNFWSRTNEETVQVLENPSVWDFAVKCMKHPKCEELSPAISFLKCITKEVFENLSNNRKFQLIEVMISVRSETDCNEIASAIASAFKRINIDSKIILPLITVMFSSPSFSSKLRLPKKELTAGSIIESREWKTGVCLLELIQSKKKLQNSQLLLKPLFSVLEFCFAQEEQTAFEYAKQLVLGCLLHCCEKLTANAQPVDEDALNVELAVQCLRASPNPQTHHHALLLLSCMAAIVPNQVMHNIMAIFTFMGTSVARLDDEHSVKIVTQVVDTVVPVLIKSINSETQNLQKKTAEILLVFVWALKDIPQHRRKPLFLQLITTLQPEKSLWILLLLLIENYALHGNSNKTDGVSQNMYLGLQLTLSMTPQIILESILKIVNYINSLPKDKMNREGSPEKSVQKKFGASASSRKSENLLDIENGSPKQLRLFVYTILTFINNLLSDNNFIVQVTEENRDENNLESVFRDTIALLMKYTQSAIQQYEVDHDKFWKAVIHHCYEMLDKFSSLVPNEMLLSVIKQLLHQSMGSLRKKALDLFNVMLQNHREDFSDNEKGSIIQLVEPVLEIVREIGVNVEQEHEVMQQTALITLKLLSKVLAASNINIFKEILVELCSIAKDKKCEGHLLGSVMLAISDQVACLRVHSVSQLSVFLPLMLNVFSSGVSQKNLNDLGMVSVTTAVYKVVDVIPNFLSPYLDKILFNVCVATVSSPENSDLNKKMIQIRQRISSNVEPRVLMPSVTTCFEKLIQNQNYDAIGPLLNTLSSNFTASTDLMNMLTDLSKFFFSALNFRSSAVSSEISLDDIYKVEGYVIESMVQLVLKLSESSFRPLYYQLCHWVSEHPERNISFFRLSCRLAENLKGLFVLFAGHFLQNAANLLDAVNLSKTETPYFGNNKNGEAKSILLLENILRTLHLVFLHDSADTSNFLNKDKFEVLLHPLVDQLENSLGGLDSLEERSKTLITPCLAQMALATDDTLWKSLNYQILVKTKSALPQVRIGALETIVAMAAKLGEDYLTLLPETIGSLAELLEDEDERVENAMKKAIQQLEEVLGQPIREYFQQ